MAQIILKKFWLKIKATNTQLQVLQAPCDPPFSIHLLYKAAYQLPATANMKD